MKQIVAFVGEGSKGAVISEDGLYRYRLWRYWAMNRPATTWLMLNPSTADAEIDDPTIRKCCGFSRRWGFGGIEVVNLFALRATDPKVCRAAYDWGGERNDDTLVQACRRGRMVIAAWGSQPWARSRVNCVLQMLREHGVNLVCLGFTANKSPLHPLMQPYSKRCVPFEPQERVSNLIHTIK